MVGESLIDGAPTYVEIKLHRPSQHLEVRIASDEDVLDGERVGPEVLHLMDTVVSAIELINLHT